MTLVFVLVGGGVPFLFGSELHVHFLGYHILTSQYFILQRYHCRFKRGGGGGGGGRGVQSQILKKIVLKKKDPPRNQMGHPLRYTLST